MEKSIKMELPPIPDAILTSLEEGAKQASIKIEDFTDVELGELGAEWTAALIALATSRRV